MTESVTMYGGPRHGEVRSLPFPNMDRVDIEVSFSVSGKPYFRRGSYSRVHSITGKAEPQFEFDGYSTSLLPNPSPTEPS